MKIPQAKQNISEILIIVPSDKLPERFSVHSQGGQERELTDHLPDRLLIGREAEDPAHQFEHAAFDRGAAPCRNTPLDLRELKGHQLIKHFFEGGETALLLESGTEQLDEHDMLAHSQNDLGHYDLIALGPGTVCVDAFGQLEKSAERKLVRRVREAKGVILGRNAGPCGE